METRPLRSAASRNHPLTDSNRPPRGPPAPQRDDAFLTNALFSPRQGNRDALVRQLAAFRDAYALRLSTYERILDEVVLDDVDEFPLLTLRYGIARARAARDWAMSALKELNR
jgi:virulence activator alpha